MFICFHVPKIFMFPCYNISRRREGISIGAKFFLECVCARPGYHHVRLWLPPSAPMAATISAVAATMCAIIAMMYVMAVTKHMAGMSRAVPLGGAADT